MRMWCMAPIVFQHQTHSKQQGKWSAIAISHVLNTKDWSHSTRSMDYNHKNWAGTVTHFMYQHYQACCWWFDWSTKKILKINDQRGHNPHFYLEAMAVHIWNCERCVSWIAMLNYDDNWSICYILSAWKFEFCHQPVPCPYQTSPLRDLCGKVPLMLPVA